MYRAIVAGDLHDDITSAPQAKGCSCQFQLMVLHHGVTLEVNGTVNHWPIHRKLYYVNAGVEGSGPQNVTCVIHDARFLMCSWGVGPAAPDDVQYFLHIRDSAGQVVTECPAYLGDHLHLGCSLEDLSLLPYTFYIIVTGSSQKAEVQFFDAKLNTKLIERLSPPDNVTVTCNTSHCEITWSQPQTWARLTFRDFRYEVDVQRQNTKPGSTNPMVRISREEQNRYIFPSPAPRLCHMVRVRAGDVRSDRWSNWSPLITFGCGEQGIPRLYLYLTVACVTLLCALGLGLVCRRYMKIQEVFPPIPEIKDKVTDNEQVNPKTLREDLLLQP
ncbi:granulocyte-macrophage colony-stimulating factor receptor subunit alpha-like isoform X2 [Acomys russatus]|uniref:granulocyte-macrophage colony-stimulating factor receptor subunit alpha-like isoform X2 n=1 Tax=Acomys russatus TaxID=60746 RepID=UPI0021E27888|nr:granulocyte-macrophage colony-stimulating factor receptor subunit alpha-like isoform X2 [Acomys russatus]